MKDAHTIIQELYPNMFDMVMMQRDGKNYRMYQTWSCSTISQDGKVVDAGKRWHETCQIVSADGKEFASPIDNLNAHEFESDHAAWAKAMGIEVEELEKLFGLNSETFYQKIEELIETKKEDYFDDVGGYHSPCNCRNPNGYFCGDCGKLTCANCKFKELTEEDYDELTK